MRLYKKLMGKEAGKKPLEVPRVITIYQKCAEHQIPDILIQRLHFNDLYLMIMSFDIANMKDALSQREEMKRRKGKKKGTVTDISGEEAVRFLKGA